MKRSVINTNTSQYDDLFDVLYFHTSGAFSYILLLSSKSITSENLHLNDLSVYTLRTMSSLFHFILFTISVFLVVLCLLSGVMKAGQLLGFSM